VRERIGGKGEEEEEVERQRLSSRTSKISFRSESDTRGGDV